MGQIIIEHQFLQILCLSATMSTNCRYLAEKKKEILQLNWMELGDDIILGRGVAVAPCIKLSSLDFFLYIFVEHID